MKKGIINFLKIALPLVLATVLIYFFYGKIDAEEKDKIISAFKRANYMWVWISIIPAILSHVSRAYRWKYTIKPLGYSMRFANGFFAVMIGYLVNLAVPRLGEFSRCVTLSRTEKIPLEKLVGTVIAERAVDFVILISFITTVTIIQYQVISGFLNDALDKLVAKIPGHTILIIGVVVAAGIGYVIYKTMKSKSENKIVLAVKKIIKGISDGILSILKMEDKWYFLLHTAFIWAMYVAMFWFCVYALPETAVLSPGAIISGFVLGGIAMVVTNGGVGAYPVAIQTVFAIYSIDTGIGAAIGWIMWTAQTLLILALGGLSFAMIPLFNKKQNATA